MVSESRKTSTCIVYDYNLFTPHRGPADAQPARPSRTIGPNPSVERSAVGTRSHRPSRRRRAGAPSPYAAWSIRESGGVVEGRPNRRAPTLGCRSSTSAERRKDPSEVGRCRSRTSMAGGGARELAGGPGFEPRLTESESAVLPLNYPPAGKAARRSSPVGASLTDRVRGFKCFVMSFVQDTRAEPSARARAAAMRASVGPGGGTGRIPRGTGRPS